MIKKHNNNTNITSHVSKIDLTSKVPCFSGINSHQFNASRVYHLKSSYNVLGQKCSNTNAYFNLLYSIFKFNNNKNKYSNKSLNNDNIHVNFFS
jgi:hypothetical protein